MADDKEPKKELKNKEQTNTSKDSKINVKKSTLKIASLAVVLIVVGFAVGFLSRDALAQKGLEKNTVGQKAIDYINANVVGQGTNASLVSVLEENGLYRIMTSYKGQTVNIYATPDGSLLFLSNPILLNESNEKSKQPEQSSGIPKTDKPSVELFVMSYCPYGTQAEKGILPTVRLLGNKINFKLEFTHFTLHGDKEVQENYRQICIREEQPDKFLPYLACILNSTDVQNPGDVTTCMNNLDVNVSKVNTCMTGSAQSYYVVDYGLSQGYGVQGSPTLIINGVKSSAGRDSASYLRAICAAFNEAPSECNTQLSSTQPGPGFGYDSVGSAQAAGCGA